MSTSASSVQGKSKAKRQRQKAKGKVQETVFNLQEFTPPQLAQIKEQVEVDLKFYEETVISLKEVQIQMKQAKACVKALSPNKTEIFVPITGSMFVRGEIEDTEHVLVEIGAGYLVEKSNEDAIDYFGRKVGFLASQIENVQAVGLDKMSVRTAITDILTGKPQQPAAAVKKTAPKK